ncbi:MAG: helix-turn-helix transcriptional regulator [Pseudomonadota bacterium]
MSHPTVPILSAAVADSGLSLRSIARRAGTSHATLSAYLHARKVPSVATLARIVEACGFALDWQLAPRVRASATGLARGEELAAVLRLADAYPPPPRRPARFPRFPQPRTGEPD